MRGGTSKALFFDRRELPDALSPHDNESWNEIFRNALGSPDPQGRQLDGMGGGISSLSKVAIIGPPSRVDADVDFTFAQVGIRDVSVGYRGNCGNISAAVGPYAVDEGIVLGWGSHALVRIHNTNTGKLIHARFALVDGKAAVAGAGELAGAAGTAAVIALKFLDPGGAATGTLLPTGHRRDTLLLAGLGEVEVSMVDAANPTVFVDAGALGLTGRESPAALESDALAMHRFELLRVAAARAMGLIRSEADALSLKNLPLVSLLSAPVESEEASIVTRMISAGQPHRATPLTGAMCLAIAARIRGSVPESLVRSTDELPSGLCIGHPSGTLTVGATVREEGATVIAQEAVVYRTARRLMEGRVFYR